MPCDNKIFCRVTLLFSLIFIFFVQNPEKPQNTDLINCSNNFIVANEWFIIMWKESSEALLLLWVSVMAMIGYPTGWPVKYSRVNDLSMSIVQCTRVQEYTLEKSLFIRYQNYTAIFNWSPCITACSWLVRMSRRRSCGSCRDRLIKTRPDIILY